MMDARQLPCPINLIKMRLVRFTKPQSTDRQFGAETFSTGRERDRKHIVRLCFSPDCVTTGVQRSSIIDVFIAVALTVAGSGMTIVMLTDDSRYIRLRAHGRTL